MNLENVEFKGAKRFLSNMWPTEIVFEGNQELKEKFPLFSFDGKVYKSSEHLYQALKSDSIEWKELVLNTEVPEKVKTLARKRLVDTKTLFDNDLTFVIRKDWHDIKIEAMKLCLFLKFSQNEELKQKLINFEGFIEERNDWNDKFWGTFLGEGLNYLGIFLMELREEFRKG